MPITVNLLSDKTGEIKSFLEKFYGKCIEMDNDVEKWIYVYNKPLHAADIISAVIDNKDKYHISLCLQVNDGDAYTVTAENHDDVIKGLFCLFYDENTCIENHYI